MTFLLASNAPDTDDFLRAMRTALENGADLRGTLILVSLLIVLPLLIMLGYRVVNWRKLKSAAPPSRYLTMAVDVLGLPEDTRRDLLTVSRLADLSQPASLLLSPANFVRALNLALAAGGDKDVELKPRMSALHSSLFGAPLVEQQPVVPGGEASAEQPAAAAPAAQAAAPSKPKQPAAHH